MAERAQLPAAAPPAAVPVDVLTAKNADEEADKKKQEALGTMVSTIAADQAAKVPTNSPRELARAVPNKAKDAGVAQKSANSAELSAAQAETTRSEAQNYSNDARTANLAKLARSRWSLSPEGAPRCTMDGGATWEKTAVPGSGVFTALSAFGNDVWVGGAAGELYHTRDDGQSWRQVKPAVRGVVLAADIPGVAFSDADHGRLTTSTGEVWSTKDAGVTWDKR